MFDKIKKYLAVFGGVVLAVLGILSAVLLGRRGKSGSGESVVSGQDDDAIDRQADMVVGGIQRAEQSLSQGQKRLDENKQRSEIRDREREAIIENVRNGFRDISDDARGEDGSD